ncbi:MAG: hypothetical protein JJW01_01880 [Alphaproteobacteria bacterium]|nr:hypothetical protein [Rickettsiales bacterium]
MSGDFFGSYPYLSQIAKVTMINGCRFASGFYNAFKIIKGFNVPIEFEFVEVLEEEKRDFYIDGIGSDGWEFILANKVSYLSGLSKVSKTEGCKTIEAIIRHQSLYYRVDVMLNGCFCTGTPDNLVNNIYKHAGGENNEEHADKNNNKKAVAYSDLKYIFIVSPITSHSGEYFARSEIGYLKDKDLTGVFNNRADFNPLYSSFYKNFIKKRVFHNAIGLSVNNNNKLFVLSGFCDLGGDELKKWCSDACESVNVSGLCKTDLQSARYKIINNCLNYKTATSTTKCCSDANSNTFTADLKNIVSGGTVLCDEQDRDNILCTIGNYIGSNCVNSGSDCKINNLPSNTVGNSNACKSNGDVGHFILHSVVLCGDEYRLVAKGYEKCLFGIFERDKKSKGDKVCKKDKKKKRSNEADFKDFGQFCSNDVFCQGDFFSFNQYINQRRIELLDLFACAILVNILEGTYYTLSSDVKSCNDLRFTSSLNIVNCIIGILHQKGSDCGFDTSIRAKDTDNKSAIYRFYKLFCYKLFNIFSVVSLIFKRCFFYTRQFCLYCVFSIYRVGHFIKQVGFKVKTPFPIVVKNITNKGLYGYTYNYTPDSMRLQKRHSVTTNMVSPLLNSLKSGGFEYDFNGKRQITCKVKLTLVVNCNINSGNCNNYRSYPAYNMRKSKYMLLADHHKRLFTLLYNDLFICCNTMGELMNNKDVAVRYDKAKATRNLTNEANDLFNKELKELNNENFIVSRKNLVTCLSFCSFVYNGTAEDVFFTVQDACKYCCIQSFYVDFSFLLKKDELSNIKGLIWGFLLLFEATKIEDLIVNYNKTIKHITSIDDFQFVEIYNVKL